MSTATAMPDSCLSIDQASPAQLAANSGRLRVLYLNDDLWRWREETGTAEPLSNGGNVTSYQSSQDHSAVAFLQAGDLRLWREETGTAEPLSSGGNVTDYQFTQDNSAVVFLQAGDLWLWQAGQPALQLTNSGDMSSFTVSGDGAMIAFSRAANDNHFELWAINRDGSQERRLAPVSAAETRARYSDVVDITLSYRWLGDTHTLVYHLYPTLQGLGEPPLEALYLVNVDTGTAHLVAPAGTYNEYELAPNNERMVAAGTNLDLIDVADGRVELALPGNGLAAWTFSPGGRYLIASSVDGAVVVDIADLSQQAIAVAYRSIGVGHGSTQPPGWWADETTWYALIPDGDVFQPGATFTLWRVNAAAGTATPINSLAGFLLVVSLSPDQRRLAFWEATEGDLRNLHLVDVATGQDEIYDSGRYILDFNQWLSDSTHFVYQYEDRASNQRCYLLGHIAQPPIPLDVPVDAQVRWVDDRRLILLEDFVYSDSGGFGSIGSGTMYLQSLNGERALIGEFVGPPLGLSPHDIFTAYFEQPSGSCLNISGDVNAPPGDIQINLLAPEPGAYIPSGTPEQLFSWTYDGLLPDNWHFEIRFYKAGEPGFQAPFGWMKETSRTVNLNNLSSGGEYEWNVVILQGVDGSVESEIYHSPRCPLQWEG
jgi:Tol biopolymer transport system component